MHALRYVQSGRYLCSANEEQEEYEEHKRISVCSEPELAMET